MRRKPKMTIEDHKFLSSLLRPRVINAQSEATMLTQLFPRGHKIPKLAHSAAKAMEKLRSALDDDICSFPENEVPDATSYYYGCLGPNFSAKFKEYLLRKFT